MMNSTQKLVDQIYTELEANRLHLPSLPDVVYKIREAVNDEKNGRHQLAKLIQMDPALTARIIQIANSPAYRSQQLVDSCQLAIAHLGMGVVRDLVTCLVMHNTFNVDSQMIKAHIKELWLHSCHVAAICYVLAKINPGFQADKALLAGLIHDIGVLPVLHHVSEYPDIADDQNKLKAVIQQLRGELGELILRKWNFADNLICVPAAAESWQRDTDKPDYVDLVIVAQVHSYFGTTMEHTLPKLYDLPAFKKLNIAKMGPDASLELLREARAEIESVRAMLSID